MRTDAKGIAVKWIGLLVGVCLLAAPGLIVIWLISPGFGRVALGGALLTLGVGALLIWLFRGGSSR